MYSIFYWTKNTTRPELGRIDYEMLDWRYAEVIALITSGHRVDRIEYSGETLLNSAQIEAKLGLKRKSAGSA